MRQILLSLSLLFCVFSISAQTELKPLKTKLNIMDERTAADLFGKSTVKDYYVLSLRLINDSKENGQNKNAPVIVYGNSIELAVNLEKQPINSGSDKQWTKVDKSDLSKEITSFNSGCDNSITYRPLSYEILSGPNSPLKLKGRTIQNALSMSIKPLEEIPYGSDITRVLFIPKRALKGLILNHEVRVSQICPNFVKGKAVIIEQNTVFEFNSESATN